MAWAVAGSATWVCDVVGSGSESDVVGSGFVAVGSGDGVEVEGAVVEVGGAEPSDPPHPEIAIATTSTIGPNTRAGRLGLRLTMILTPNRSMADQLRHLHARTRAQSPGRAERPQNGLIMACDLTCAGE